MSMRLERASKMIRQEIGHLLSHEMNDPRIGFATVTRVELAADMKSGRVYVGVIGDEKARKSTLAGITHASGYLQREVASKLRMKYTPVLTFFIDDGPAHSVRISRMLDEVGPRNQEDDAVE